MPHQLSRHYRDIACTRNVIHCCVVKSGSVFKMRRIHFELRRSLVHPCNKGLLAPAYIFGKRNGGICESSLPYSVRVKCDKNVARLNGQLRRDAQVRAERILRDDGTYTLRLALDDEHGNLLTLELLAATEQQANRLADQFKTHPEQVYNGVLDVLLTDFDEKE